MTTTRLNIEYDYKFFLLGVSCHLKDYRFCWALNKFMGFDLRRQDDHVLQVGNAQGHFAYFRNYQPEETGEPVFSVVCNRSEAGLLIPEHREYDFFLMAENLHRDEERMLISKGVQKIKGVLIATRLTPGELSSRQNLIIT